jgi:predicted peptidase
MNVRMMMHILCAVSLTAAGLVCGCSTTQPVVPAEGQYPQRFERLVTKTVRADYLLYVPENVGKDDRRWPLMIFLHGSGERGSDLDRVTVNGPPKIVRDRKGFPFILASPQLPDGDAWSSDVIGALLDELIKRLPVDTDRVYLTGLSLGGYATWDIACDLPGRFAAIAPVCGLGDADRACRLKGVPVWAFHGAKDPVVPLEGDKEMVDAVRACGGNVQFTIYPDAGHDCWTAAYGNPELYSWFLRHRRTHTTQ